jgi:hypothetical protein
MKSEGDVDSGDRIRIIGFSEALEEHSDIYENLPEGSVTVPGSEFPRVDTPAVTDTTWLGYATRGPSNERDTRGSRLLGVASKRTPVR